MDVSSLCPKCGIEFCTEPGSRCPLCGTPLEAKAPTDPSLFAPTNPSILAPSPGADVIPEDPDSAPTTRGWALDAKPPDALAPPAPPPSAPFTPMPALVPPTTMLPPPPFVGAAARSAPGPLPGPSLLSAAGSLSPFVDPHSDITTVGPVPGSEDGEPVPASSLEYDRPAGENGSPPPRSRAPQGPPPPSPWGGAKASGTAQPLPEVPRAPATVAADVGALSPTRVSFRPMASPPELRADAPSTPLADKTEIGTPAPLPRSPAPASPPPPPRLSRGETPAPPRENAVDATVPVARAVPAPARTFSQSPAPAPSAKPKRPPRVRGFFLFLLALAGIVGAFTAGRYTAAVDPFATPKDGSTPVGHAATPGTTPGGEEKTGPSDAPSPKPKKSPAVPEATQSRRARARAEKVDLSP